MANETIIKGFDKAKDLFERKNTSYSNAWVKVGQIFNIIFEGKEVKLSTERDFIIQEIMTRKLEKFIRFLWQSLGENAEELVGEGALETLEDDGVYAFMLLGYLREELDHSEHQEVEKVLMKKINKKEIK